MAFMDWPWHHRKTLLTENGGDTGRRSECHSGYPSKFVSEITRSCDRAKEQWFKQRVEETGRSFPCQAIIPGFQGWLYEGGAGIFAGSLETFSLATTMGRVGDVSVARSGDKIPHHLFPPLIGERGIEVEIKIEGV
jgi:hypothetical protein